MKTIKKATLRSAQLLVSEFFEQEPKQKTIEEAVFGLAQLLKDDPEFF